MAVKKRCPFCNKRLRPDGTCQTKTCPLYVPEPQPEPEPTPDPEPTGGNTAPEPSNKETK